MNSARRKKIIETTISFFLSGNLPSRHKEVFHRNPLFVGMRLPEVKEVAPFGKKYPRVSEEAVDVMKVKMKMNKHINHYVNVF